MLQRPKTQKQFSKHCETNQTKFCIQYFAVAVYFVFRAEEICRQISMFQFAVVAVIPRRKLPKRHTHTHTNHMQMFLWCSMTVAGAMRAVGPKPFKTPEIAFGTFHVQFVFIFHWLFYRMRMLTKTSHALLQNSAWNRIAATPRRKCKATDIL